MSDFSDRDDSQAAEKRRRIQRACDACRRKKIKCDGPSMADKVCTNCRQYNFECKYIEQAKKRGPPKGYVESVEARLARMENLITRLAPGADFSAELGARIDKDSFDLAVHQQSEPVSSASTGSAAVSGSGSGWGADGGAGPSRTSHSPACAPTEVARPWEDDGQGSDDDGAGDDEEEQALLTAMSKVQLRQLTDDEQMMAGFAGKSSSLSLLLSARDYKYGGASDEFNDRLVSSRRPMFWNAPIWENSVFIQRHRQAWPPEDLCPTLVDLFFEHKKPLLPVLHEPTFRCQFADRLYERDRPFRLLCLAVLACGSRFTDDERVRLPAELIPSGMPSSYAKYSAGWPLMGQIMAEPFDWNAPPTLCELQQLVLMTSFLTGSSHPRIAWVIIGVGVRHCLDLGLHREHVLRAKPKAEAEQWRRAFWCLYGLDRSTAGMMGRPLAIHDEDIDVDYPLDVDDEYWETSDPARDFVQPAGKPSQLGGFIAMLKLHQISGYCLRTVYCINKAKGVRRYTTVEAQQQLVAELDSALNSWLDGIPPHLKWDPHNPDEIFMQQSAHLYASYYSVQIFVHRPFIPPSTRPSKVAFPSLAICSNAARSGAHVIETARHRARFRGSETVLALHGWTFSIVLLINIWGKASGSIGDPASARADVEKMKRFFADSEQRWLMAGRLADVLHELASQSDLPARDPASDVTPSHKRARDANAAAALGASSSAAPATAPTPRKTSSSSRASADLCGQSRLAQSAPPSHASPAPSLHHSNASSSSFADPALDADIVMHRHLPTQPQVVGSGPGNPAFGGLFNLGSGGPSQQQSAVDSAQLYAFLQSRGAAGGGFPPATVGATLGQHQPSVVQPPQPQQPGGPFGSHVTHGLPEWMFPQQQQQSQQRSLGGASWPQQAVPNAAGAGDSSLDNTLFSNGAFAPFSPTTADNLASPYGATSTISPAGTTSSQTQGNIQGLWENAPASFEVDEWSSYLAQFGPGP